MSDRLFTEPPATQLPLTDRRDVNASWLLRLRWVAVVGQLLTVAATILLLHVQLAVMPLLTVVAFTALTNVAFGWWLRSSQRQPDDRASRQDQRMLGTIMGIDLLSLTALLYFSGGPANPFIVFYFVNLALAAVVLPSRWSWSLLMVALFCLAFLFQNYVVVPELSEPVQFALTQQLALQQMGLVTAVAICAGVAIYFITRVTRELQQREEQLRRAQHERARAEHLEGLATLAAGAGHELASPLSTIAVIANDLSKQLDATKVSKSVIEDVGLIRSELDHCRHILDGMASGAGLAKGEEMRPICVKDLIAEVLEGLPQDRIRVALAPQSGDGECIVPLMSIANSLRGIIRNALDATASDDNVDVSAAINDETLLLTVEDRGTGMAPETLSRAGEPFFTTKEPGKGMGLGLFLAQNLFQRLGGELRLESQLDIGTKATVRLPLSTAKS